jgi:hypothetical protein
MNGLEVRQTVVPILGESRKGEPCAVGSGVLVSLQGRNWIITAAHVLDEVANGNLYLGGSTDLLELQGEFFRTPMPPTGRNDDPIDVGYVCIDSLGDRISKDFCFLPESLIEGNHSTEEERNYIFTGYPHKAVKIKGSTRKITPQLHSFESKGIALARYQGMGLDPNTHLAIPFNAKRAKDAATGRIETPKDQSGTSGGGVWIGVPQEGGGGMAPRLVGLVIEHRSKEKTLVATKIGPLLANIKNTP